MFDAEETAAGPPTLGKATVGLRSIQDLAPSLGVSARTLRYYEEQGLVSARRGGGGARLYDSEAVARLSRIVLLRRHDLSLNQIRTALASMDDAPLVEALKQARSALSQKLSNLDALIAQMSAERASAAQ